MKFRHSLLLIPVTASLVLSGCTMSLSSNTLIHPPKTVGNQAQIEQLIEKTAGGNYTLKYPKSGEYRSAIITIDLNNDQSDEAIAFYRTDDSTHMLVMYDSGDSWTVSYDYETSYSDVDCIDFTDYDFDGYLEFFTGFVTDTPDIKQLTVFDFDATTKETTHIDFSYPYSKFTTGNYDNDGANEAMLLTLKTSETDARATLVDYDGSKLYALASCAIDSTVTKYENVMSDFVDDSKVGVIIDGLLTSGYNSQVIIYDTNSQTLINSNASSVKTERAQTIYSQDIDNDTFVEVPAVSLCSIPKNKSESDVASMITWYRFNTGNYELEYDKSSIVNFEYKYSFYLPSNFIDTTTTIVSENNATMSIYALNKSKLGKLLVTFKAFDTDNLEEGYTSLGSNGQYTYGYKINPDELPLYIDDKTVQDNFALYEAITQ